MNFFGGFLNACYFQYKEVASLKVFCKGRRLHIYIAILPWFGYLEPVNRQELHVTVSCKTVWTSFIGTSFTFAHVDYRNVTS